MNEDEKEYCWSVKLGHTFKETLKPFTMPRIRQTFEFLPLSIRYLKYHRECQKQNIQAHMDFFRPVPIRQIYGAPIGGIGTGSIGRSFSGDFCRFSLVPGLYDHGQTCSPFAFEKKGKLFTSRPCQSGDLNSVASKLGTCHFRAITQLTTQSTRNRGQFTSCLVRMCV